MIKGKYSGERIKRGLYETHKGILVNADINASLNILRKSNPNLECIKLLRGWDPGQKVGPSEWLHKCILMIKKYMQLRLLRSAKVLLIKPGDC